MQFKRKPCRFPTQFVFFCLGLSVTDSCCACDLHVDVCFQDEIPGRVQYATLYLVFIIAAYVLK